MSEDHKFLRKIFSEAVEIADARGRADYIVQACGDNAASSSRVRKQTSMFVNGIWL